MPLIVIEAMKMETNILAPINGFVKDIYIEAGDAIETGDFLIQISEV
jgi:pyruvate carboxylase